MIIPIPIPSPSPHPHGQDGSGDISEEEMLIALEQLGPILLNGFLPETPVLALALALGPHPARVLATPSRTPNQEQR